MIDKCMWFSVAQEFVSFWSDLDEQQNSWATESAEWFMSRNIYLQYSTVYVC